MIFPWKNITSVDALEAIQQESYTTPVVLFKHSTSCGVSASVKKSLEGNAAPLANENYYFLDLLSYRDISNAIASLFEVQHQSPQIILLKNGKAVYTDSHYSITFAKLKEQIEANTAV